jgi:oligoendopeptidase F
MTAAALPRWDLSPFFTSLDDRRFAAACEEVGAGVARLRAHYDTHDIRGGAPRPVSDADRSVLAETLDATNALGERLRLVNAYLYARVTTDARDDAAAARQSQLQQQTAALGGLAKRLEAWIARLGAPALLDGAPAVVGDHAFTVTRAAEAAAHQLSEAEEDLVGELRLSGSTAWARLHRDVTARLTATVHLPDHRFPGGRAEVLPMSVVRGMAYDPHAAVRRAAYDGELAAWAGAAVPLAAALNGAKGEESVLNRRRGWPDDLEPALWANHVDRATLDALTAAVVDALPRFRRYLRAKAALLGHGEGQGLPWWDLFAPVAADPPSPGGAGAGPSVSWPEAVDRVRTAFASYSPTLAALVDRAISESWVDAEPREGKVSGAYCLPVQGGVSRVLLNFDGSPGSVQTLAHELGHAYHGTNLESASSLQRRTPSALAETASIFCQTIMGAAQLAGATGPERLALLDSDLQGATQCVVDIRSRFLFESALCRRRATRTLGVDELGALMLECQEATYGDGLDPDTRHPWMWAVKGHYFSPFYNWPYTFGFLFGLGLHRRYEEDPARFRDRYDDLLASTGRSTAADLAAGFGLDVHDEAFWASGLDAIGGRIDNFVDLVGSTRRSQPDAVP